MNKNDFSQRLNTASIFELKRLGFYVFGELEKGPYKGKNLYLIPGKYYGLIKKGQRIVSISGRVQKFIPGQTDTDTRNGMLPYGVIR